MPKHTGGVNIFQKRQSAISGPGRHFRAVGCCEWETKVEVPNLAQAAKSELLVAEKGREMPIIHGSQIQCNNKLRRIGELGASNSKRG